MKQHKLRLSFDFTISIDESVIPPGSDEEERDYNERQQRLLHAVLSDPEALQAYLVYQMVTSFDSMSWQGWHAELLGGPHIDSDDILRPVIAKLAQEDQQFFAECTEEDVFFENIELFDACFSQFFEVRDVEEVG